MRAWCGVPTEDKSSTRRRAASHTTKARHGSSSDDAGGRLSATVIRPQAAERRCLINWLLG